jgi:hypothetical protein
MGYRQQLRSVEWEAVAGIIAAVLALVLHFLHIIEEGVLVMITLVLLSLLFIRDLRQEHQIEEIATTIERTENLVRDVQTALPAPSVELIGPESLRSESARFGRNASGDMIWFHVFLTRAEKIADEYGITITTEIRVGNPSREIITCARDFDAIVIGNHKSKLVSRLLRGNVANTVVRHSSVPVTVLH